MTSASASTATLAPAALDQALEGAGKDDLLIVDFDETLLLRNSTELFLDHAAPAVLAAIASRLIEFVKPWRLWQRYRDGFAMADWLRVLVVVCLMPWVVMRWRRVAPAIAAAWLNSALAGRLADGRFGRIVVASHGFAFIIRPLLRHMPFEAALVASPLWWGFRARAKGKRRLLEERYGAAAVARATVITDHADNDADILAAVANPVVIAWPEARYQRAFARTYVPLLYTEKAKHTTHLHLLGVFFAKDWMVLVTASALLAPNPLLTALGLAFLIVSFAVLYDVGYHENDCVGARLEEKPVLSEERIVRFGTVDEGQAWLFGTLAALPGVALLAHTGASAWLPGAEPLALAGHLLLLWLGLLAVTRGLFWLFNRVDEKSRMLLHLPLQLMKGLLLVGILALPASPAGVALLLANAFCCWIPYLIYRMGGARWATPDNLTRLLIFLSIATASAIAVGGESLLTWQAAAVLTWAVYKARKDIARCLREAHFLRPRGQATPAPAVRTALASSPAR